MNKGNAIVATPSIIGDLYFHRSVILMVDYTKNNSMGFIINKKLEISLNKVTNQIKRPFPLYYGGPVETDNLFFIYKSKINISRSLSISESLSWGGNFDEIIKSERKYLERKKTKAISTDLIYFWKAFVNIVLRGARSQ